MFTRQPHPNQLDLDLSKEGGVERMIEARAAIRAEHDAIHWRCRLILIETTMIALLVLSAGLAMDQPAGIAIRSALIVGVGCLVSGLMLIGLSGVTSYLLLCVRRRRQG
jgi:hypothetical protein